VIGVLEAVILVLVVGLSFDYTLHYGAAVPAEGCPLHRIREAASLAICPVSLSAFTSFLAGASMLFSSTHAFFQVGEFLVVISIVSQSVAVVYVEPSPVLPCIFNFDLFLASAKKKGNTRGYIRPRV